ncbi:DNA-binding protein [Thalassotalea maritima]|uniref:DNA-binding protein n=1 Tax=Thalassotalea maritima TaxID=3242416 RepID=UPI003529C74F
MSNLQNIYQTAYQLAQQGKTPSVALIKGKLGPGTPLTQIIKGLQTWQSNPELGKPEQTVAKDNTAHSSVGAEASDKQLEQLLAPLIAQISELNQQVAKLSKQINQLEKRLP